MEYHYHKAREETEEESGQTGGSEGDVEDVGMAELRDDLWVSPTHGSEL